MRSTHRSIEAHTNITTLPNSECIMMQFTPPNAFWTIPTIYDITTPTNDAKPTRSRSTSDEKRNIPEYVWNMRNATANNSIQTILPAVSCQKC